MPSILYICGSINQTSQMVQIASHLPGAGNYFTPYYDDGLVGWAARKGLLEFSILGRKLGGRALRYLRERGCAIDMYGQERTYDLVLTCSDLLVPRNIRSSRVILVQEGMTDPETLMYYLAKYLRLPRWLASTSTTGLSDLYDRFCVASEGYRDLFIRKGVRPEKLTVTGIPNFDNCLQYRDNTFSHHHFVLVATSDARETFKYENRGKFVRHCMDIAGSKQLIFKLHPNENHERATQEINELAPDALVYTDTDVHHMIANCDVLITRFSSVVYVGLALGKQVYSEFDLDELKAMTPIQNGGQSAENIAAVCEELLIEHDADEDGHKWDASDLLFAPGIERIAGASDSTTRR